MKKVMRMVIFGALTVAILLQVTTAHKEHIVGDNFGWSVPINGATAYTLWASANTFHVGDTLVFKFTTGNHDVQEVSRSSFEDCNTQNSLGEHIKRPANITIDSPGDHYYICTVGQHCLAGQKIAIKVSGTNSPASSTPANNTQSSPSSSTITFEFKEAQPMQGETPKNDRKGAKLDKTSAREEMEYLKKCTGRSAFGPASRRSRYAKRKPKRRPNQ